MTFLSLENPCLALVLQPHSTVSNLSLWHCSIMHLPLHTPLSTNVLSGSYISRNNMGGTSRWGLATVLEKGRKLGQFFFSFYLCAIGSWNKRKDWKPLPPTHWFFIPLFGFSIPPLAGIVRFSNSFYCRTSWVANGNPHANRRLCVIMVFWGYLSKSCFRNDILNLDIEGSSWETSAMSQCVVSFRDIPK